jgi:hypothetical protein
MYGYLCTLPEIALERAFDHRIKSPTTMYRKRLKWEEKTQKLALKDKRDFVYAEIQALVDPDIEQVDSQESLFSDNFEAVLATKRVITFEDFERLQQEFMSDRLYWGLPQYRETFLAFKEIAKIKTGKILKGDSRGKKVRIERKRKQAPRHQLSVRVPDISLPAMPLGGGPTIAADLLCDYLDDLLRNSPEQFRELLKLWLFHSEGRTGKMNLYGERLAFWRSLPETAEISMTVVPGDVDKVTDEGEVILRKTFYGRIRIKTSEDKEFEYKDVSAVRWVLTWAAAVHVVAGNEITDLVKK